MNALAMIVLVMVGLFFPADASWRSWAIRSLAEFVH